MPAGRPTDYSEKIIEQVKQYISQCETDKKFPSIEGLAVFLEITRPTIYDWKEKHEEFSYIIDKLLAIQAEKLMSNGLIGKWNPTITKLLLTKHGYSDRQETDLTSGGKPIPILTSLNVSDNNGDNQSSQP